MGLGLFNAVTAAAAQLRRLLTGPVARLRGGVREGAVRTKRLLLASLLLLPSLSACGALGRSSSGVLPQSASAPLAADAAVRETQTDSAPMPAPPFVAGPDDLLYVANAGDDSITVYHTGASGNTAPLATIKGSKTELRNPGQLSEDAHGDLYVSNGGVLGAPPSSILVFKHGANGNVAPLRVIAGARTGLSAAYAVTATVDRTTGEIFAMAGVGPEGDSELIRFPSNASGDAAPLATSQGTLSAQELAFDSTGKHVINASNGCCDNLASFGIYTYDKQFRNAAALSSIYTIDEFYTAGIAGDPASKTYLVSTGGTPFGGEGIFRFDEDTVGHGADEGGSTHFAPAVVSIITSDTCGTQLALGYERAIYVAHSTGTGSCAKDAVYVYAHDASGDANPLRILSGSATKLDQPNGIYEGK